MRMACNGVMVPTCAAAAAGGGKEVFKEHNGLRKSLSCQDLISKGGAIRRSNSDNQLCYVSVNGVRGASAHAKLKTSRSVGVFSFQTWSSIVPTPIKSLLFDSEISQDVGESGKDSSDVEVSLETENEETEKVKRANWVERMLEIRRQWKDQQKKENVSVACDCIDDPCVVDYRDEEEKEEGEDDHPIYDRESFSRLLVKMPWSETRQFSRLASLCNMAYVIPEIKANDLSGCYGLKFVTSSLEKKAKAAILREKLEQGAAELGSEDDGVEQSEKRQIRSSAAYKISASAASYIQSCAQPTSPESNETVQQTLTLEAIQDPNLLHKSAAAAHAATSTMTAVVAAGEKEKQEAARELQSLRSSPCEWFACDDPSTNTRCFVIQGSDSLASWQANLFFEPTNFEGTDVLVHRGIYEAAKGIYNQFMPEIIDHLNRLGDRAKFQFTGHSLGGSLSLMVNLMLVARRILKPEALRPVVTFGSPFVFCGGKKILEELGLDESHVHCVMMHRDIVPRAFSCNYPNHVALLLKRLNGAFQSHPCLDKNKLLYSPMGKVFILQPNERASPPHPLLPQGNALYVLDKNREGYSPNALLAFLNCPHPLETLSHPTAYGSDGSILRDHEASNYVKAVNGVLRQQTKLVVRKVRKQRQLLWPLLSSSSQNSWGHHRISAADHEVMTRV